MFSRARILSLTAIAVIPLVLCSILAIRYNTATHEARIIADRISLARAAASTISTYVDGNLATLRALARSPALETADQQGLTPDFLVQVVGDNPDWDGIELIRADGTTLTGSTSTSGIVNPADRPYFQQVMATGQPSVSEPIIGRIRGEVTLVLAAPVEFSSGQRGALVVPLLMSRLAEVLQAPDGEAGMELVAVDAAARAVLHPDPTVASQLASFADVAEVDTVRSGETGVRVVRRADGTEHLVAFAPVRPYAWGVLAWEPTVRAFAAVRSALIGQLSLLALAVLIVGATAWLLGTHLMRAYQTSVRARTRAEFLAWMSAEFDRSLDYETTLAQVAARAVPQFADWCAVDLVDATGDPRRVAVAHVDPAQVDSAQEMERRFPPDPTTGVPWVIRTGAPLLVKGIPDEALAEYARDPEHLALLRSFALTSALIVPMAAHDQVLGALTFVATGDRTPFGTSDLEFAQDAATRAALAVENARLRHDLERAMETRNEYFAATAHDLRSPLTAIRGTTQMQVRLLSRLDEADADLLRPGLARIESATSRLARLASGLLDLARLEGGRPLDLERTATDLVALTRRVVAEAEQTSDQQTIVLTGEEELIGIWDANRLERVVANLLENALKYSGAGTKSGDGGAVNGVDVRITREERNGQEVGVLVVRDHGMGIPPDDLPHVFDPFRRGSNVTDKIGGTGLGLAGARHIVEEHGGTITIESMLGKGTTVRIELPTATDPLGAAEPDAAV